MLPLEKVSVILVSKDRPEYLQDALESLVVQKKYIKEILIFDKSEQLDHIERIKNLSTLYNATLFLRPSTLNTSTLRNEGIQVAQGEFLCFLDDDDYLFPNYMERQLSYLQNGISLVFCNYITIKHPEHPVQIQPLQKRYAGLIQARTWTAALAFRYGALSIRRNAFAFIATFIPIIHGAMFRKDALDKIRFSDQMVFCEDLHFWILFYKNKLSMEFNNSVLAIYRIHESNWSSLFTAKHNLEFYSSLLSEGAVSGKVNYFILLLKILKFSRWGQFLENSQKKILLNALWNRISLLPYILLVFPYYITLKYQNNQSGKSLK